MVAIGSVISVVVSGQMVSLKSPLDTFADVAAELGPQGVTVIGSQLTPDNPTVSNISDLGQAWAYGYSAILTIRADQEFQTPDDIGALVNAAIQDQGGQAAITISTIASGGPGTIGSTSTPLDSSPTGIGYVPGLDTGGMGGGSLPTGPINTGGIPGAGAVWDKLRALLAAIKSDLAAIGSWALVIVVIAVIVLAAVETGRLTAHG